MRHTLSLSESDSVESESEEIYYLENYCLENVLGDQMMEMCCFLWVYCLRR